MYNRVGKTGKRFWPLYFSEFGRWRFAAIVFGREWYAYIMFSSKLNKLLEIELRLR